jgi:hypothetical protein
LNRDKRLDRNKWYYEGHKEIFILKQKEYHKRVGYEKQPRRKAYKREYDKIPQMHEYKRRYRRDYDKRPKRREYNKKLRDKLKNTPSIKAKNAIRLSILQALGIRGISKSAITVEYLGCSVEFFKLYIESKFTEEMSWENHGLHGWHLDHIRPCASFDLSIIEEQKKCFHYTNYQPLWAIDNLKKGAKLVA